MADTEFVTIYIDDQEVQAPKGTVVVEAAKAAGVEIPVFCHHSKLEPVGMCRMCLVEVGQPARDKSGNVELHEDGTPVIRWFPKLMTGCTTPVSNGMRVRVDTQRVADAWRGTLEFLLTSHPLDCPVCDKGGECPLQDLTMKFGPDSSRFYVGSKLHFEKPLPLSELIWLDQERCIYCARCIRFCDEIAGDPVLSFAERNRVQRIVTYSDPPVDSYFSGNTTDVCPVGALTTDDFRFKARAWELNNVPSICPHCPVGCNIVVGERANDIKRIMPRDNEWVNEIWICDKGRFGHHFVTAEDRLETPLIKQEDGTFRSASWEEALDEVANRLAGIASAEGAAAIGGLAGSKVPNEDLFLFVTFFRDVLGSPNVDHRLHWPVGTGIERAVADVGLAGGANLGALGKGSTILLIGSDLQEEQPVTYLRVRKARGKGADVIVAQARPVKEQREASHRLSPQGGYRTGGEAHLVAALLKALFERTDVPADVLETVEDGPKLRAAFEELSLDTLAETAGVDADEVRAAAATIAEADDLVVMVGREALIGADANASALVNAAVGLLVATGKAGKKNSGLVALWPHNNSQGACDMGVLPDMLPGYEAAEEVGATVDEMLDGQADLKALYVMGADPARDRPESRDVLAALDFLVVQELFLTETAQLADVVLPAAAFAEREGTFTSMERRVQRFDQARWAPGDAMEDWWIIAQLAERFDASWPPYAESIDVMADIAGRVALYEGMTYGALEGEPVEWTTTAADHHIRFAYTGTAPTNSWFGKQWAVSAEAGRPYRIRWPGLRPPPVSDEAIRITRCRVIPQRRLYDNGTLIRKTTLLDQRRTRPYVLLSATDAERRGIAEGESVRISVNGASVTVPARIEPRLQAGAIVLPVDVDGIEHNALTAGGVHAPLATIEPREAS